MISPGKTKIIDESVPAAEATVWTMLFSWIVASRKLAQDRHRNHRRRDRCRKSERSFEPGVHIRRGENQRDDDADDETADGEFFAHRTRRIVCNPRNGQDVAINSVEAVPDSSENGAVGNRDMAG